MVFVGAGPTGLLAATVLVGVQMGIVDQVLATATSAEGLSRLAGAGAREHPPADARRQHHRPPVHVDAAERMESSPLSGLVDALSSSCQGAWLVSPERRTHGRLG